MLIGFFFPYIGGELATTCVVNLHWLTSRYLTLLTLLLASPIVLHRLVWQHLTKFRDMYRYETIFCLKTLVILGVVRLLWDAASHR